MPVDVYQSEWKDDLFNCIIEYKKQHKFLDSENLCQWHIQETCNYQKYKPGQHYSAEHSEHGGKKYDNRRMIAWTIYCNTINKGKYRKGVYVCRDCIIKMITIPIS